MKLELIDAFQNGQVTLKVYDVNNERKYWLRVGQALLELDNESISHLWELLNAFVDEDPSLPVVEPQIRENQLTLFR